MIKGNNYTFYTELVASIANSKCAYIVVLEETHTEVVSSTGKDILGIEQLRTIIEQINSIKGSTFGILDFKDLLPNLANKLNIAKIINSLCYSALFDENKDVIGYLLIITESSKKITSNIKSSLLLVSKRISEEFITNKIEAETITESLRIKNKEIGLKFEKIKGVLIDDFNFSNDIFCVVDGEGKFLLVSKASTKILGYTPEELIGTNYKDYVVEEDLPKTLATESLFKQSLELNSFENRYIHKNGSIVYLLWSARFNTEENLLYSIAKDITEYKKVINNQRKRTQFIETTLENLPIGVAINKIDDGSVSFINHKFSEFYGWPKEDLKDVALFFEKLYPDAKYREQILKQFFDDISSRDPEKMSWDGISISTKSGQQRIVNAKNIPIYDQNLMISTVVDVTEKFKIEKQLKDSNERYFYATKATSDALWDWDVVENIFYWGEGVNTLFGYNFNSDKQLLSSWEKMIHPNDLERVLAGVKNLIQSERLNWTDEYMLLKGDGTYAHVLDRAFVIRNSKGDALRLVGAIQDITKRKQEELQLKLLESVVTNINDAVLITEAQELDEPGPRILYVNDAFTRMTGYTSEDVIGKSPRFLQGPKTDKEELKKLSKAIRAYKSCDVTIINYDKKGSEFWVNFEVTPVTNEQGLCTHFIAIQRDVTAKKIDGQKSEFLNNVSVVFNNTTSLEESIHSLLKNVSQAFDYPLLEFWLADEKKGQLNLFSKYYDPETTINVELLYKVETHIPFRKKGEGLLSSVWEERKTKKWINNKPKGMLFIEQLALKSGINKVVAAPILYNNEFIGALLIAENESITRIYDKIIFSEEVSQHLGTEIRRKQLEEELSKIFNFSPDIICVIDSDGLFKKINPAGCELLEYTENELLSMTIYDLIPKEDLSVTKKRIKNFFRNKIATRNFENRIITTTGKLKWMAWTFAFSKDGIGYAVGKDITEKKESINQLKLLNESLIKRSHELSISNKELEQFAFIASHDLQEPLRMVTSFLTLIEKKYSNVLDEKGLQYVNFAVEGAKSMHQIILDILDFSRIDDYKGNYGLIEVADIIDEVCLLQKKLIKEKNAKIIYTNLPKVNSNRHYLIQIFQNFINNALKYSRDNVSLIITIESKEFDEYYQFSIKDNGIGIDKEYFDKIFVLFQRLHDKEKYAGTGVGLAIVKKIVDKLKGKVWVTSEVGVGSTFYINIPRE